MSTFFADVPLSPPDPVFGLQSMLEKDDNPKKMNLGIGAYRDESGHPWVLPVVRKAKELILTNQSLNHEYLPISGIKEYCDLAAALMMGDQWYNQNKSRVACLQSLSGTGALRIAAEFVSKFLPKTLVYISNPSWGNHKTIFSASGLQCREYRYWDPKILGLDLNGMLEDLENAPEGSLIILHACAHNPTGVDPTQEQWKKIAEVVKRKKLFPLFDSAYQGFASGDLDKDAFAVRYFAENGFELILCQSFAKNFGLYSERTGLLSFVTNDSTCAEHVRSQIALLARANYSNPPKFGALIVLTVLKNKELFQEWRENLKTMSGRIIAMRKRLFDELKKRGTPGNWEHIVNQIGMFSFTGLNGMSSLFTTISYLIVKS